MPSVHTDCMYQPFYIFFQKGEEGISVAVAMQLAYQLGSMRLVLLQPGKIDIVRKIRLNVSTDDVTFALDESV